MKIPGQKHFRSFSIYAFVMFFNAAISFVVFSWLTHHLSTKDFGIINLYNSYCILLVPFISFGVQFILNVDYFKMKRQVYANHFLNGMAIPLFTTMFIFVGSLLFLKPLLRVLGANTFFVLVAPFTCFLIVLNDISIGQIRNRSLHGLYARYSIFKTVLESALVIIFIAFFAMNWQGRLGGALLSLLLCGLITYWLFKKWGLLNGKVEGTEVKQIAHSSLPFIPERLAIFFLSQSDRFFIKYFEGTSQVGLYGAGSQVGTIVNLVTMALSYSFQPMIFKRLASSPIDYKGLRNVILAYIGISFLFTVALIISIPLIFHLFIGEAFKESSLYAINLSIAGFFWAVYNAFLSVLLFYKKTRQIMFIAVTGTIISLFFNYINIREFGPVGATYTTILVYFCMSVLVIFRVNKYFNLKAVFFGGK